MRNLYLQFSKFPKAKLAVFLRSEGVPAGRAIIRTITRLDRFNEDISLREGIGACESHAMLMKIQKLASLAR